MKKICTIVSIWVWLLLISVMALGMYKFNYLASQPGYDVDGNKMVQSEEQQVTSFP